MNQKLKLLFLCTGNSCRSRMAEAWTRALKGELIEAWSVGTEAHGLDPIMVSLAPSADVGHNLRDVMTLLLTGEACLGIPEAGGPLNFTAAGCAYHHL